MATVILDPTTLGCDCHQRSDEPVVAFGRWQRVESPRTSTFGPWELLCEQGIRPRLNEPGYQFIFLDPARQRRPQPNPPDQATNDHFPDRVGAYLNRTSADDLRLRPDPA